MRNMEEVEKEKSVRRNCYESKTENGFFSCNARNMSKHVILGDIEADVLKKKKMIVTINM